MKNIRSLKFNKKILAVLTFLSLGYLGVDTVDKKIEEIYKNRKSGLEDSIGNVLDKNIELGDYKGLRGFGFGISNSKIFENENINSNIEAKRVYVGIMPIRSFLNQKWIINITPKKVSININKGFLKREQSLIKNQLSSEKVKYDLNFHIKEFSNLRINDLDLESKIKGKFRYSSKPGQIIGYLNAKFNGKDNLKLKLNKKLNQDKFSFQVLSRGINLKNFNINTLNRKLALEDGKFKSNFKFYRSSTSSYCKGGLFINKLNLKTTNFEENFKIDSIKFFCKNNNLLVKTNNLNYGSLLSDLSFNIPLNQKINNTSLDGIIRFEANPKSNLELSANMPYWFDNKGRFYFGKIDSKFKLTSTELANLNIFQKNGIQGTITAKGDLKGNIFNPDLNINFKVNKPTYNGIRFRETWAGDVKNKNNEYQIDIDNVRFKSAPIPSFLSLKFDSNIKLKDLILTRIGSGNKGTLNIVNNKNNYSWEAKNLPLNELELSTNKSKFDRISGTVNGTGTLSTDLSMNNGNIELIKGKFRDLELKKTNIDFVINDSQFDVFSYIIPDDGGIIKISYKSDLDEKLDAYFDNVSTKWSILNALNTFKFKSNNIEAKGKSGTLKFLETPKFQNYLEQINAIEVYKKNRSKLESNPRFEKYFNEFESRYSGNLKISGNKKSNYKIASEIDGFIDLKTNNIPQNKKEYFSLKLNGGLFEGKGNLLINQIPLKTINIFLEDSKDFKGSVDLALIYDLKEGEKKEFESRLFSKNTSINDYELDLEKGEIGYNILGKDRFNFNFSIFFDEKNNPIELSGDLPRNKNGILSLDLYGKNELLKLIDVFYGDNINFKKGEFELDLGIKGPITKLNKPIYEGDLIIKDAEIEIFNNNFKNINTEIKIDDGDQVKVVKEFKAFGENKEENISIKGTLPIYEEKISEKKILKFKSTKYNLVSKNNDFVLKTDIDISGSFEKPTLEGNINLSNGFVYVKNSKNNNKIEKINKKIINKNNLQDRLYSQNKSVEINPEEEITISEFVNTYFKPKYLFNLTFDEFKVKIGPNFKFGYANKFLGYLETPTSLEFNKSLKDENDDEEVDLEIRGLILVKKGRVKSGTTPFRLARNNNSILFVPGLGVKPLVSLDLTTRVPETILTINQNNQDGNVADDLSANDNSEAIGAIGIGNSRKIKIDAYYYGVINKISIDPEFENYWLSRLDLRSTPGRSQLEIIALIAANSADIVNRTFVYSLNESNPFSQRFQLSLYPAIIENKEPIDNVFSNEKIEIDNNQNSSSNFESSSQAWVAEIGYDISNRVNFAVQAIPNRDDLSPQGILSLDLTLQETYNLELLGSFDYEGDWKSQVQLFRRF